MFGVACAISLMGADWSLLGKPGLDYVENEVLVGVKVEPALAAPALRAQFGDISYEGDGLFRVRLKSCRLGAAIARLEKLLFVSYAEPNYIATAQMTPNDPGYHSQYGIKLTRTDLAWEYERGTTSVMIAVLDTGIDFGHPEFRNRLWPGYDFVNRDLNPSDDNGHGTMCAGIAAAEANNAQGIAGVAHECTILPVKVLKSNASGSYDVIAKGIRWAADQDADVISLSLAGTSKSSTLENAVKYALSKGVAIVAAAGNDGKKNKKVYPASYAGVISVGACDRRSQRLSISNYGTLVSVAAPGDNIYSTYRGSTYRTSKGTSLSTAFVAGQAALLKSYLGPSAPPGAIRLRIENSAIRTNWLLKGIVDVKSSILGEAP